jgi:hypothetical protein
MTAGYGQFRHKLRKGAEIEIRQINICENGRSIRRIIHKTPVGEIYSDHEKNWCLKHLLETAEDYRVMRYIAENQEIIPDYAGFERHVQEVGPDTVIFPNLPRSPMQTILVDYAGLENFSFQLADLEDDVLSLYEIMRRNFRRAVEITAEGPGKYVSVLENFTAETMGPERFRQFLLPVYQEFFPELHRNGKIVGVHYDGRLAACKDLISGAPIDLIESLTLPPEGDMSPAECREAWPNKRFWSNINLGVYALPQDELRRAVLDRVEKEAVNGRLLAFEVSENIPDNWRESLPVVMETLEELG